MEEKMEEILKRLLEEKVEEYITESRVDRILGEMIEERVRRNDVLKETIDKIAEDLVVKRIEELIKKPVTIDNGWGNRKTYESFDDLIKAEIEKKITGDYEIRNSVASIVKDKFDKLIKANAGELMDIITSAVSEKLGLNKGEKEDGKR